jgi:Xaa-Pro aminopeptidase
MIKSSAKLIRKSSVSNVALEGDSLPLAIAEAIDVEMPKVDFVTTSSIVEKLREIKSRSEVTLICKAVYAA